MTLPHLILVTGKGGTGKSTVSGALALALSSRGKTILADLDQRWTTARLLGVEINGLHADTMLPNLETRSFTARTELEAFITRIVPIKSISRRMLRSHTFGYVTAALPGLEAFLMLERLRLLANEAEAHGGFAIVDAPASGSLLELLSVSRGVRDLSPRGTLKRLSQTVDEFLEDPRRFGVLVTARPEQLAIREALETVATLRTQLGIRYMATVLNCVPDPLFSSADCAKIQSLAAHQALALRRAAVCKQAARAIQQFDAAGVKVIQLPMLYTPEFARPQLQTLARVLDVWLQGRRRRSEVRESAAGGDGTATRDRSPRRITQRP
jgi:arsenite/tail-anchored protein-transporting ATPase